MTPIPFAKGVKRIHFIYKMAKDGRQCGKRMPVVYQSCAQLSEEPDPIFSYVQWMTEERLAFFNKYSPLLPCPIVNILEHVEVQSAKVRIVEGGGRLCRL